MADPGKWLGLMKWSMKYQDGTTPSQAKEMSKEDRDFLDKVLKEGIMDENERVRDILRILDGEDPYVVFAKEGETIEVEEKASEEELAQYKDALLDELLIRIDQIDNAMNMVKSKGLETLIRVIQNYERASTRALAAEVCSVVVQNNPFCQDAAVEIGLLEVLCELTRDADTSCQVKALLAISCLVRHHKLAEARFLSDKCDGLNVLASFMQPDKDIRLQRKSLFFLRYLIRNSISTAQQVLNAGFYVPLVTAFVASEDIDLCESALQALAEFAEHDVYFATACKRPEHGLLDRLDERIAKIDALEGEEREFAAEIRNLAVQLQQVLATE